LLHCSAGFALAQFVEGENQISIHIRGIQNMTRIVLLTSFLAVSSCMLGPTDDQRVSSPTETLTFNGYHWYPNSAVQVQAFDYTLGSLTSVGPTVSSDRTASATLDRPLYGWIANRMLTSQYWKRNPAGGSCAQVAAKTTIDGSDYSLMTVESNWAECLQAHNTTGSFASHCRANNPTSVAKIFTNDWANPTVTSANVAAVGRVASSLIRINLDNFTENPYEFCNAGNPAGCPEGGAGDPETWKYFLPGGSSIARTGFDGTTTTMNFAVAPKRDDMMTVYIDNMSSNSFGFRLEGSELIMNIGFEAVGPEIRLNCIRNIVCVAADNKTIDFTAPRAEIRFPLVFAGGKITYASATASFFGNLPGSGGLSGGAGTGGETGRAEAALGQAITEKLNNDVDIKNAVSEALETVIRGFSLQGFPIEGMTVASGVVSLRVGCPLR
jgi:hypothetical protein